MRESKSKTKEITKHSKNKYLKFIIAVMIIIISALVSFKFIDNKKDKEKDTDEVTQSIKQESNDKLSEIQAQIDEQQKVIDQLNEELAPLVEQRTELEKEMLKITEKNEAQTNTTQE